MLCNSSYHIFLSVWLKITEFKNDNVDIIVSDHTFGSEKIAERLKSADCFENVYYVKTKAYIKKSASPKIYLDYYLCDAALRRYISLNKKYDILLAANIDSFTKLLYIAIVNGFGKKRNPKLSFYIFEDGTSTYSKLFEKFYNLSKLGRRASMLPLKPKVIYKNVKGIYAFDKDAFLWKTDAPIIQIKKIDKSKKEFKKVINYVFDYESLQDKYDRKYIFFEENFLAGGYYDVKDTELVKKIADIVGRENIMVKIHPRNPKNRFKNLGYKTNENTALPWEVIVLNENMEDKVLLSIASTSILNPVRIFGDKSKAYSLYKCMDKIPGSLSGYLWDATEFLFKKYYPYIEILSSIEDLQKVL